MVDESNSITASANADRPSGESDDRKKFNLLPKLRTSKNKLSRSNPSLNPGKGSSKAITATAANGRNGIAKDNAANNRSKPLSSRPLPNINQKSATQLGNDSNNQSSGEIKTPDSTPDLPMRRLSKSIGSIRKMFTGGEGRRTSDSSESKSGWGGFSIAALGSKRNLMQDDVVGIDDPSRAESKDDKPQFPWRRLSAATMTSKQKAELAASSSSDVANQANDGGPSAGARKSTLLTIVQEVSESMLNLENSDPLSCRDEQLKTPQKENEPTESAPAGSKNSENRSSARRLQQILSRPAKSSQRGTKKNFTRANPTAVADNTNDARSGLTFMSKIKQLSRRNLGLAADEAGNTESEMTCETEPGSSDTMSKPAWRGISLSRRRLAV